MESKRRSKAGFLALQRRQLDASLRPAMRMESPKDGWIKAVRTALGMTASQLGKRLKTSQQAVAKLEHSERHGGITLATLARVANALDCELQVLVIPKTSLEQTVRRQAERKARSERNRIVHTMRLEAQDSGVEQVLDEEAAIAAWMSTRIAKLWE